MYTVVRAHHLEKLITEVNELIKEGWRPIGGILKYHHGDYFQAMIKDLTPSQ